MAQVLYKLLMSTYILLILVLTRINNMHLFVLLAKLRAP